MDELPAWMYIWLRWLRDDRSEIAAMGFPDRTPCLIGGWSRGAGYWDDLEDSQDSRTALVVDAQVRALNPGHKAAVEWVCGLQRVARPRDLAEVWASALAELENRVRRAGIAV